MSDRRFQIHPALLGVRERRHQSGANGGQRHRYSQQGHARRAGREVEVEGRGKRQAPAPGAQAGRDDEGRPDASRHEERGHRGQRQQRERREGADLVNRARRYAANQEIDGERPPSGLDTCNLGRFRVEGHQQEPAPQQDLQQDDDGCLNQERDHVAGLDREHVAEQQVQCVHVAAGRLREYEHGGGRGGSVGPAHQRFVRDPRRRADLAKTGGGQRCLRRPTA